MINIESGRFIRVSVVEFRTSFVTNQVWTQFVLGYKIYDYFTVDHWLAQIYN